METFLLLNKFQISRILGWNGKRKEEKILNLFFFFSTKFLIPNWNLFPKSLWNWQWLGMKAKEQCWVIPSNNMIGRVSFSKKLDVASTQSTATSPPRSGDRVAEEVKVTSWRRLRLTCPTVSDTLLPAHPAGITSSIGCSISCTSRKTKQNKF